MKNIFKTLLTAIAVLTVLGNGCGKSQQKTPTQEEPTNNPPIADAGPDLTIFSSENVATFTLNAGESFDPDGDAIDFSWSLKRAPTELATAVFDSPFLAEPKVFVAVGGNYIFGVIVSDGKGGKGEALAIVKVVFASGAIPEVNAGPDQIVPVGFLVKISATCVNVFDNQCNFNWSLIKPDGSNAELVNLTLSTITFLADVEGVYTVTVVGNDGIRNGNQDFVTVTARP